METFYFGRLNYVSNRNLLELLLSGYKYRHDRNTRFGLFGVETLQDRDLGLIFTGELIKYVDYKSEDVIKDNEITIEYISDAIRGRSRFFLTNSDHLIAYNPYGRIISDSLFKRAFSGILLAADDSFYVDSIIYPINIEYQFRKFIGSMRELNVLTFDLTPSNPNNRDIWRRIDERLNGMNAKKYKEEFLAKDGKSIAIDAEAEAKITMAEDGYGKVTGHGKDADDNDIVISTDRNENIVRKKIEKDQSPNEQIRSLSKTIESIRKRFIK